MTGPARPPAGPVLVAVAAEAAEPGADPSAADVLSVAAAVTAALVRCGVTADVFAVSADLAAVRRRLERVRPALVFNLVESLAGMDSLQAAFPILLDGLSLSYTGCSGPAMALSNDKLRAKRLLARAGCAVAPAAWLEGGRLVYFNPPGDESFLPADVILKPTSEHASLFMDDAAVLRSAGPESVAAALSAAQIRRNRPFFAERFLPGREFSVSIVSDWTGVALTFPPAEITFASLPPGRPGIVGYAAKWEPESVEFQATPRRFLSDCEDPAEAALATALAATAIRAWDGLAVSRPGAYARVDFRSDGSGRPVVLEVNTNPCLSPDSGFAAAAERGGIAYEQLVLLLARAAGLAFA